MKTRRLAEPILWLITAAYIAFVVTNSFFHLIKPGLAAIDTVLFLIGFAILHALLRYSLKDFVVFAVITFFISNAYENVSILTGFPFGHYHYSDVLAPSCFSCRSLSRQPTSEPATWPGRKQPFCSVSMIDREHVATCGPNPWSRLLSWPCGI